MEKLEYLFVVFGDKEKQQVQDAIVKCGFKTWSSECRADITVYQLWGPQKQIGRLGCQLIGLRNSFPWTRIFLFDKHGKI